MTAGIVPILAGVEVPGSTYGDKSAPYADLVNSAVEDASTHVVPADAAPAPCAGDYGSRDLRRSFDRHSETIVTVGALMVRSSEIGETPGKNESRAVLFDRRDIAGSFKRFLDAVDELRSVSSRMGILLTRMTANPAVLGDGHMVLGSHGVTVVATSHAGTTPCELSIALAHGLGRRAVEDAQAVLVYVDRDSGRIVNFINQSRRRLGENRGSLQVQYLDEYRQSEMDVLDTAGGTIIGISLSEVFTRANELWSQISIQSSRGRNRDVGLAPFHSEAMISHVVSRLVYLSARFGRPVQIEGAFPDRRIDDLQLFQSLAVQILPQFGTAIDVANPFLKSERVLGAIDTVMPLVFLDPRRFGEDNEKKDQVY